MVEYRASYLLSTYHKIYHSIDAQVIEQNVSIVVMITHLFEGGKPKCDQYWPDQVQEEKDGGGQDADNEDGLKEVCVDAKEEDCPR